MIEVKNLVRTFKSGDRTIKPVNDVSFLLEQGTLASIVGKSGSGWIASFLSGEGLVCHFKGQGRIWIQTRNATAYGQAIGALLPGLSSIRSNRRLSTTRKC